MKPVKYPLNVALFSAVMAIAGCATPPNVDYTAFRNHRPRSILVLPPLNKTTNVNAPYTYLSTITQPLAECGYYVFPVAVVDAYLKENGLPGPDEMHGVALDKIRSIIGADAVLYIMIEEWGQKYIAIQSMTVITAHAKLVDTATGQVLWQGKQEASQGSGGADPIAMLVSAAVQQIMSAMVDYTHQLSVVANNSMVYDTNKGFIAGPYSLPGAAGRCKP